MITRKRIKSEVIQLRVTKAMKERLKTEAEEKNQTLIAIIEEALRRYFEDQPLADSLKSLEQRVTALEQQQSRKKK